MSTEDFNDKNSVSDTDNTDNESLLRDTFLDDESIRRSKEFSFDIENEAVKGNDVSSKTAMFESYAVTSANGDVIWNDTVDEETLKFQFLGDDLNDYDNQNEEQDLSDSDIHDNQDHELQNLFHSNSNELGLKVAYSVAGLQPEVSIAGFQIDDTENTDIQFNIADKISLSDDIAILEHYIHLINETEDTESSESVIEVVDDSQIEDQPLSEDEVAEEEQAEVILDVNDSAQTFTSGSSATASENVNETTVLYTATATDEDTTGETILYQLIDDAGGLFEINSSTGEVTLVSGQSLDYETATSHNIIIQSSDGTNKTDHSVTIHVSDIAETVQLADGGDTFTDSGVVETSIVGGSGDDIITGHSGDDTIAGGYGDDVVYAGDGDDRFDDSATNNGNDTLNMGAGDDTAIGGDGNDIIDGGSGDDTLLGEDDDDIITGGSGNDTIRGGSGDDIVIFSGNRSDYDIAYSHPSEAWTLIGPDGTDTVFEVETFRFDDGDISATSLMSTADQTIYGTDNAETINGGSGDDTISGRQGDDIINAGDGDDRFDDFSVGNGNDTINMGAGDDIAYGGDGTDTISGGTGNDTLSGENGNDIIDGGDGNDAINGGADDDTITGGAGNDTIEGSSGTDTAIYSGNWSDYTITLGSGTYTIVDNRSGSPDGTDTVSGIDNFQFADGTVDVSDLLNVGPTDIGVSGGSIDENSSDGTVVATLSATDANTLDGHTYSITSDTSGFFEIVGNEVRVKSGASLDYETVTSHNITVEVTDSFGSTYSEVISVSVNDLAETITLADGGETYLDNGIAESQIRGGSGDDNITTHADGSNVLAGTGNDTITGNAGTDTLRGGDGNDIIDGVSGGDYLYGNDGDDTISGGSGDDIIVGGEGADIIDGGAGDDTVSFSDSTSGVTVNLTTGAGSGGTAQGDTYSNIEDIRATDYDDHLTGDSESNRIDAYEGNDTLDGAGGNDTLYGLEGNDILLGGEGDDYLHGGTGDDTITGGAGDDRLWGGDGTDTAVFTGNRSDYSISESSGTYTIVDNRSGSPDGTDTVSDVESFQFADRTVALADILNVAPTDITYTGGTVNESVTDDGNIGSTYDPSGSTVATLFAADADSGDSFTYAITNDPSGYYEIAGNEVRVKSGQTIDFETAASHNITLEVTDSVGNSYSEIININVQDYAGSATGTSGNDSFTGTSENDNISGEGGNDYLVGGAGDDIISGGDDNDTLLGGTGADTLDGGSGTDWVSYSGLTDSLTINLDTGLGSGGEAEGDSYTNIENVRGGSNNDIITGDANRNMVIANEGDDIIDGGAGDDELYGNDGNDTITGGTGEDYLSGGAGNDIISGGDDNDTLLGGTGSDTLDGGSGTDWVSYSGLTDSLTINLDTGLGSGGEAEGDSYTNIENVRGGSNNDIITGDANRNMVIANEGDDIIDGGAGDDELYGNDGNDTITGGSGDDYIDAGADTDTVIYTGNWSDYTITENSGTYTIVDNRSGSPDGTDIVTNVENFEFADGTIGAAALLNVGPTDIGVSGGSIAENSSDGTVVATLSTTDSNSLDSHTYSITSDPSGFFEIVGDEVRVASGASLDYETAISHNITIEVTDTHGSTYSEVITINVTDVNEAPTDISYTGGTVNETVSNGGNIDSSYDPSGSTVATLSTTDEDAGETFSYAITSDPSGHFEIVDNEVRVKSGQTIDYEISASHDITVEVTDSSGNTYSEVIAINVQDYEGSYTSSGSGETITGTSEENNLTGDSGSNTITASDSGDTIDAKWGNDTITGGAGNDTIYAGQGADTIYGGDGDDYISSGWGNAGSGQGDLVYGGAGNDIIDTSDPEQGDSTSNIGDTVYGEEGDDQITGGTGDDIISGGADDDTIDASDGTDTAIYSGNWSDYTITENAGTYTIVDNRSGSPDGTDTVTNVENFQFADGTVGVADLLNTAPFDVNTVGSSVNENSGSGTVVGTVSASDLNTLDNHTYTLTSDPSGFFEVVGNEILVKAGASLDYETATSHNITVQAEDAGGSTYSKAITVTVTDTNDVGQVFTSGGTGSGAENINDTTVVYTATTTDADTTGESITYSLTNDASGLFEINSSTGEVTLASGQSLDYEMATSHNITIQSSDGVNTTDHNVTINVTDVNDAPTDITMASGSPTITTGAPGTATVTGEIVDNMIDGSIDHWSLTHNGGDLTIDVLAMGYNSGNLESKIILFHDNGDGTFTKISDNDDGTLGADGSTSVFDAYISETGLSAGTYMLAISNSTMDDAAALTENDDYPNMNPFGGPYQITFTGDVVVNGIADDPGNPGNDWGDPGSNAVVIDGVGGAGGDVITASTVVATASGIDADAGDTFTYNLTDDANGMFSIDSNGDISLVSDYDASSTYIDTVTVRATDSGSLTYDEVIGVALGTNGNDTKSGTSNSDVIYGFDGNDNLNGNDGDDIIHGGDGNDTLDGDAGDDIIIGGAGMDTIDGGTGTDTIDYSSSSSAVTVNLTTGTNTGGDAQGDILTAIENIIGSANADNLTGDTGDNQFTGGAGNDVLVGSDGNDIFLFSEGHGTDTVDGGSGASWTDAINLSDSSGGSNLGAFGSDWTVSLTEGSISSQTANQITLTQDADGTITLQDGSQINFTDIEQVNF